MNPPPPDLPPPSGPASLPPPSLSVDLPPPAHVVRAEAQKAAPAVAPTPAVETKKPAEDMSSPKAPAEKPPVKVYGPSTAPPPGVSSNLPPPAVHVAEVVVSKLSQPSAKPAPSAKKKHEEIPDRAVLGTAALIEHAKTWPWRREQPKFMRVGLMLALVLGIAGLVQIVGVVIGIVIAVIWVLGIVVRVIKGGKENVEPPARRDRHALACGHGGGDARARRLPRLVSPREGPRLPRTAHIFIFFLTDH